MAVLIILQFMMQTALVAAVAILFLPVIHHIAFDAGTFENSQPFIKDLVATGWVWSIVFFVAALAGNIVWFLRALQRKQAEVQSY